ncbi:PQQ-binding-like beta-propeller repeat protein [Streptomyces sp. NPDC002825]|uniref:outer membrane protein assembly factor BamB family protein n=1 Tax=Streptomyces sp. NPDC002825 TaxID=3154666 RepID=UPI0033219C96
MADASGGRAVVHDRQGALIALDLETGAVLWRHGRALRPCAIVGGNVVALRMGTSPELEVELLDAGEGTELWTSPTLALPPWAHPTLQDSPEFTVDTAEYQDPLVIRWTARALYRGGAPPGPAVAGDRSHEAHGALRVGVATPSVEPLAGTATVAEAEVPERPPPRLAPDVLDYGQVGALRLELTVRPGSGGQDAVVLRAVDPRTAAAVWEVVLDETAETRPRRLRP